jgi:hypothetical protein
LLQKVKSQTSLLEYCRGLSLLSLQFLSLSSFESHPLDLHLNTTGLPPSRAATFQLPIPIHLQITLEVETWELL